MTKMLRTAELVAMRRLVLYMREQAKMLGAPVLIFLFEMAYEELRQMELNGTEKDYEDGVEH